MNVGENDDGQNYNFFSAQVGYRLETGLGEGNYRLVGVATSEAFFDEDGDEESLTGFILSFDQELGDVLGAFIRFGWQDDDALIDYDQLYSGGLNVNGRWYGREEDNIGVGYAFLNGENDFDYTQAAEVYWRVVLNDYLAVTADVQYMEDHFDTDEEDEDFSGFIFGVRLAAEF